MKATIPIYFYAEAGSERYSKLKSVLSYMLPDSFSTWSCATLLSLLACWGGVVLGQTPAQADILWPANGVMLAFLLLTPRRFWFSYLISSVAANMVVHRVFAFPVGTSLLFSFANTVEIVCAAVWLAPEGRQRPNLVDLRKLGRFLLYGVLLAPLASTIFVQLALTVFYKPSNFLGLSSWYIGDSIGIAIMTPLILAVDRDEVAILFRRARWVETVGILAGITLLSVGVFSQSGSPIASLLFPVLLLFPALLLVIFRLGSSGAAIGLFLTGAPAAYFTSQQHGPLIPTVTGSLIHSILLMQCALGVSLVTIYSVSAALGERDRLQEELSVAYHEADNNAALDHVTGLANRRAFDKHLAIEWRRAIRENVSLSLIMIDVDQFKLYNDHYGHVAGDACLRAVGAMLGSAPLRASDLAARYGGEEFAVILPRAGADGTWVLANLIRQNIADQALPHCGNMPGIVTVSMGTATIQPRSDVSETSLIEMADQALYVAKKEGRNQVQAWNGPPQA